VPQLREAPANNFRDVNINLRSRRDASNSREYETAETQGKSTATLTSVTSVSATAEATGTLWAALSPRTTTSRDVGRSK
jgi:hypothetical protein